MLSHRYVRRVPALRACQAPSLARARSTLTINASAKANALAMLLSGLYSVARWSSIVRRGAQLVGTIPERLQLGGGANQHNQTGPTSLESRFFIDNGTWHDAPLLTGQTCFEPLADVKNILATRGEGFM